MKPLLFSLVLVVIAAAPTIATVALSNVEKKNRQWMPDAHNIRRPNSASNQSRERASLFNEVRALEYFAGEIDRVLVSCDHESGETFSPLPMVLKAEFASASSENDEGSNTDAVTEETGEQFATVVREICDDFEDNDGDGSGDDMIVSGEGDDGNL